MVDLYSSWTITVVKTLKSRFQIHDKWLAYTIKHGILHISLLSQHFCTFITLVNINQNQRHLSLALSTKEPVLSASKCRLPHPGPGSNKAAMFPIEISESSINVGVYIAAQRVSGAEASKLGNSTCTLLCEQQHIISPYVGNMGTPNAPKRSLLTTG